MIPEDKDQSLKKLITTSKKVKNGKVIVLPMRYEPGDHLLEVKAVKKLRPIKDQDGNSFQLAPKPGIWCPKPAPGRLQLHGFYSVPPTRCRRCEHRVRGRYCALLKELACTPIPTSEEIEES